MTGWLERVFGRGGIVAWHGIGPDPLWPTMHVTPEGLRDQLDFLTDHYQVLPLGELLVRHRAGRSTDGLIALTFDDAYLGVARYAHPLLAERRLPATIFVSTTQAEAGRGYWWDLAELLRREGGDGWHRLLTRVGLPPGPPDNATMERLRSRVLRRFSGRLPDDPADEDRLRDTGWRSLDFNALRQLAAEDRYDFGCHTLTHPALPFLDRAGQEHEMREGLAVVRARLGRAIPVVAYPYGLYDRGTIEAAKGAGMMAGVTMEGRATGRWPDQFTLPRVGLGQVHGRRSIALRLSRAMRPVLVARNRGIHPKLPSDPASNPGTGAVR